MRKKVLILSTTYGQGHMATAQAIEEGLDSAYPGQFEIEIVDFTNTISRLLNKTSKRMYEDTTKYVPLMYKFFFESTDYRLPIKAFNELNFRLSREKIRALFARKKPDIIICNSPHWQYIVSLAREDSLRVIPLVSVITDSITLHAAWASGDSDYYIVPNTQTARSLHELGVSNKKIQILGYPIRLEFSKPITDETRQQLGLPKSRQNVLYLASGNRSLVARKTLRHLRQLLPDAKIVAITGRDTSLTGQLRGHLPEGVQLIGWTQNVANYIKASNVVITKAGGSTVMECIGTRRPVVINKIIPGQEEGNAIFVTNNHLGIVALDPELAAAAAKKILTSPASYARHLAKAARPEAALNIAKFVQQLLHQ